MQTAPMNNNPVSSIRIGFGDYISKMKRQDDIHRVNGIPDYAFSLDLQLREQIRKLPYFYALSKRVAEHEEARYRQVMTASALQVGPKQLPDIYETTIECAKRLGIGPPNVFVVHDQSINAATYASDTTTPTIMIHSGLIERVTPGELKCVIAHECGHIHNEHNVYMSIANLVQTGLAVGGLVNTVFSFLSQAALILIAEWSRAAEVTCDRAAMICSDNTDDAINVNKKLLYGTFLGRDDELNIDDIRSQFEHISSTISVFTEMYQSHPSSIRRVLASDEFTHCDILYKWRPELKKPGMELRTKEESDKICAKYTAVFKEARKGKIGNER